MTVLPILLHVLGNRGIPNEEKNRKVKKRRKKEMALRYERQDRRLKKVHLLYDNRRERKRPQQLLSGFPLFYYDFSSRNLPTWSSHLGFWFP